MTKRERNKIDKVISAAFHTCGAKPISIMKIGSIFQAGYDAHAAGADVAAAVVAQVRVLEAQVAA